MSAPSNALSGHAAPHRWAREQGLPHPLGQVWVSAEQAYNFAVYSARATRVDLLLFAEDDLETPAKVIELDQFSNKSSRIWHARIAKAAASDAKYYAYRVSGPSGRMDAFDPEKLAVDPFARCVYFPPSFSRAAAVGPGSNAGRAPLAVLCEDNPLLDRQPQPRVRHEADLIIYEMHVRGFTASPTSGLPEDRRGTYAGVIDKIPYLQELGVTEIHRRTFAPVRECL